MIVKTIKCKDITFETLKDIFEYKQNNVDHNWHITLDCIKEIQELSSKIKDLNEKEAYNTIGQILEELNVRDEEQEMLDNALKMNSVLQSKPLKTTIEDDMDDEADQIINEEVKRKAEISGMNITLNNDNEYTY